jgi:cysteine-rich repeat protein
MIGPLRQRILWFPVAAAAVAVAFASPVRAATTTTTSETSTSTSIAPGSTTTTLPPPTTHLQCFRAKDPLRLKGPAPWLDLVGPQLKAEQCSIVGSYRLVCLPVGRTITQPIQQAIGTGPFKPFTPTPLPTEEELTQDRICYRIRCTKGALPDPATKFIDEFGSRVVTKTSSYLLCGPAVKALCGDGVIDPGEQCDDGNAKSGDCCSSTCQLEAAGATCVDTDANVCTVAQCDGAGTCDQTVPKPLGTTCPDTDGKECTVAQCDGAGLCDQTASKPVGTACTDTDGNGCTAAQCDANGNCDQTVPEPAGTACTDTDGNGCTAAQCTGAGICDQTVLKATGTLCTDTDGNLCTRAACNTGTCVQDFFVRQCTLPATCNTGTGQCQ